MKMLVTLPLGECVGGAKNMLWTFLRHIDRSRIEPTSLFLEPGPFDFEGKLKRLCI